MRKDRIVSSEPWLTFKAKNGTNNPIHDGTMTRHRVVNVAQVKEGR
jgi:hypothetical protein